MRKIRIGDHCCIDFVNQTVQNIYANEKKLIEPRVLKDFEYLIRHSGDMCSIEQLGSYRDFPANGQDGTDGIANDISIINNSLCAGCNLACIKRTGKSDKNIEIQYGFKDNSSAEISIESLKYDYDLADPNNQSGSTFAAAEHYQSRDDEEGFQVLCRDAFAKTDEDSRQRRIHILYGASGLGKTAMVDEYLRYCTKLVAPEDMKCRPNVFFEKIIKTTFVNIPCADPLAQTIRTLDPSDQSDCQTVMEELKSHIGRTLVVVDNFDIDDINILLNSEVYADRKTSTERSVRDGFYLLLVSNKDIEAMLTEKNSRDNTTTTLPRTKTPPMPAEKLAELFQNRRLIPGNQNALKALTDAFESQWFCASPLFVGNFAVWCEKRWQKKSTHASDRIIFTKEDIQDAVKHFVQGTPNTDDPLPCLLKMFDELGFSGADFRPLLHNLALIPKVGCDKKQFLSIAFAGKVNSFKPKLRELIHAFWITECNGRITVHPLLNEIIYIQLKNNPKNFKYTEIRKYFENVITRLLDDDYFDEEHNTVLSLFHACHANRFLGLTGLAKSRYDTKISLLRRVQYFSFICDVAATFRYTHAVEGAESYLKCARGMRLKAEIKELYESKIPYILAYAKGQLNLAFTYSALDCEETIACADEAKEMAAFLIKNNSASPANKRTAQRIIFKADGDIASSCYLARDYEKARELHEETLEQRENFTPDYELIFTSSRNSAALIAEAEKQDKMMIVAASRDLASDYFHLAVQDGISIEQKSACLDESVKCHKYALEICESLLGTHYETMLIWNRLAGTELSLTSALLTKDNFTDEDAEKTALLLSEVESCIQRSIEYFGEDKGKYSSKSEYKDLLQKEEQLKNIKSRYLQKVEMLKRNR